MAMVRAGLSPELLTLAGAELADEAGFGPGGQGPPSAGVSTYRREHLPGLRQGAHPGRYEAARFRLNPQTTTAGTRHPAPTDDGGDPASL
ncbi:hypothetical protein GCM10018987_11340 [Streptomyces cremeus]